MALTYRSLMKRLQKMDDSVLDNDVTVHDPDRDEYQPVNSVWQQDTDDVLDAGAPILELKSYGI